MNRVERAIILAAGKGERMRPLTLTTPKPLLKVFNQPIIEHSIELLLQKGITEIYIVVGYLAEQFQYLVKKYGVTIIKNEQYDSCNNISSLFLVRDRLKNAVVLDGDIWISDDSILLKEFDYSGYTSVWTDTFVNEWVQHTDNAGFVTRCARNGDENGWILYSISYWSEDDASQLKTDIETEFLSRRHTDLFWDDVAMFCYPEKYTLKIKPVPSGALSEFDNIQEIAAFDETYKEVLL